MKGPTDYIEVKDRIQLFLEAYPEGSLQGTWAPVELAGETLIVYTARAYRHAEDARPGVGTASEPFPGKTNFTRGSELANCETSAWGRAIVALGIAAHKGVASAQDVRKSQLEAASPKSLPAGAPTGRGLTTGAPARKAITTEQRREVDGLCADLGIDDKHLAELMCKAVNAPAPTFDGEHTASMWVEKALGRFPVDNLQALLDLVLKVQG